MSEELKTLKDFFKFKGRYIEETNLKAEAVKWVKKDYIYLGDGEYKFKEGGMKFRWHDLFKHFFNLTEEDLK